MTAADYTSPLWTSAALVVIDLQNDFLDDGQSPIPGTSAVLGNVASLTSAFRDAGRPIAHVIRLYEPFGSDVDAPRRAAVEAGQRIVAPHSAGSQIPDRVLPRPATLDCAALLGGHAQALGDDEVIFYKPRWSAFHRTTLDLWLKERDITTIVVAGCNLPNCPRATLFDASERDYRAVAVADAMSQTSIERLSDLERLGVSVLSTAEVIHSTGQDDRTL